MKATDQLKEEHEGVRLMLSILEKICQKLETGETVDLKHLEDILEFIQVFVDRCHHGKEETLLLPDLKDEEELSAKVLAEHTKGREYVKNLGEAIERYQFGDESAASDIISASRDYAALLDEHIEFENETLFSVVDEKVSPDEQEELFDAFEKIEEEKIGVGKHEQFHQMLSEMEKIYCSYVIPPRL